MKLADALKINQTAQTRKGLIPMQASLCCGFTSLQLQQLLAAQLHQRFPDRMVEIIPAPYGDAIAAIDHINSQSEAIFLIIEWQDLDPRLGIRQADWRPSLAADILQTARLRLDTLVNKVTATNKRCPIHLSLPQLPTPVLLPSPQIRQDSFRTDLEQLLLDCIQELLLVKNISILSKENLPGTIPAYDLKNDIRFGCPYSIAFLSILAQQLISLAFPSTPTLKGLITDLDNTLWRGIIGDVGADGVSWDLDQRSLMHAVYQQKLQALAEQGVLLAIASKNDIKIAQQGISRSDLRIKPECLFPQEIHWQAKSESVARILKTWNVSADSVLFIDDSAAELAEVQLAHPEIHTRQFPTNNDLAALELVQELAELFTKNEISKEDLLRASSIRQQVLMQKEKSAHQADPDVFLRQLNSKACITVSNKDDPRAFELLNKTNQFNLNGIRLTSGEWSKLQNDENTVILTVEYEDKFGKLGEIAVLVGIRNGTTFEVCHWVLSCRAFSRRIEHLCLQVLFDQLKFDTVNLNYRETERNEPVKRLIANFTKAPICGEFALEKQTFCDYCPHLYHSLLFNS